MAVDGNTQAEAVVDTNIASVRFRAGAKRGSWRLISYEFPVLFMAVSAISPTGDPEEYCFRFELTDFPGTAPEVKIWNQEKMAVLEIGNRPKGSRRVLEAFKANWPELNGGSVYRPWERSGLQHNGWSTAHPGLAWHPGRDLSFILEDLHGLLTSNTAVCSNRPGPQVGL